MVKCLPYRMKLHFLILRCGLLYTPVLLRRGYTAGEQPLPPYTPGRNRPTWVPFPGKDPFPDRSYYEMTREAAQMVGVGRRWDDYEPGPAPGPQG
jgi:hypothetical protein